MMRKIFLAAFIAVCLPLLLSAQEITWPAVSGFKLITKYPVFTPDNLWDFINGAADGYNALGFRELNVAEYKKGKDVIKLEIYRHSDHTMAFGIYASERSASFRFMNLGAQGYKTGGSINFFTGNHYVKIRTYSQKDKTLQAAESLAMRVSQMLGGDVTMPQLLTEFPDEGRKVNEEMYIDENVLGHGFLAKAFKASYASGNDNLEIYLMKPGTAADAFSVAEKYLSTAGIEPDRSEEGRYVFTDGYNGTIFLSWKNDVIVIISGLAKDQADLADEYTSAILD